jgi:hypothetical protein
METQSAHCLSCILYTNSKTSSGGSEDIPLQCLHGLHCWWYVLEMHKAHWRSTFDVQFRFDEALTWCKEAGYFFLCLVRFEVSHKQRWARRRVQGVLLNSCCSLHYILPMDNRCTINKQKTRKPQVFAQYEQNKCPQQTHYYHTSVQVCHFPQCQTTHHHTVCTSNCIQWWQYSKMASEHTLLPLVCTCVRTCVCACMHANFECTQYIYKYCTVCTMYKQRRTKRTRMDWRGTNMQHNTSLIHTYHILGMVCLGNFPFPIWVIWMTAIVVIFWNSGCHGNHMPRGPLYWSHTHILQWNKTSHCHNKHCPLHRSGGQLWIHLESKKLLGI